MRIEGQYYILEEGDRVEIGDEYEWGTEWKRIEPYSYIRDGIWEKHWRPVRRKIKRLRIG